MVASLLSLLTLVADVALLLNSAWSMVRAVHVAQLDSSAFFLFVSTLSLPHSLHPYTAFTGVTFMYNKA